MTFRPTFYRRHLPHWQPDGATLFVTFRLAGSLPKAVIEALRAEQEEHERALLAIEDTQLRAKQAYLYERRAFGRWDMALDAATHGPYWLTKPEVAPIIVEALHYRDRREYDLLAFCVMSNHVHLVCAPLQKEDGSYYALHRIMQSLKRHTARQANLVLQQQGTFWQDESYDHVARDAGELARIIQYVLNNPVKAGLVANWQDWPWIYCKSDWQSNLRKAECHSALQEAIRPT